MMKILRLRHGYCERNLADVHRGSDSGPHGVTDGLYVTPRPNVNQDDYTPDLSLVSGRTYTWHCVCGRTVQRRHEQISALWTEHAWDEPRVVVATLSD